MSVPCSNPMIRQTPCLVFRHCFLPLKLRYRYAPNYTMPSACNFVPRRAVDLASQVPHEESLCTRLVSHSVCDAAETLFYSSLSSFSPASITPKIQPRRPPFPRQSMTSSRSFPTSSTPTAPLGALRGPLSPPRTSPYRCLLPSHSDSFRTSPMA